MSRLVCQKCDNGLLNWLDNPDEVTEARMKCEKCGKVTTMKKFCKIHPIKNKINRYFGKITILLFGVKYIGLYKTIKMMLHKN